jgi:acyl carrier protein
MEHHRQIIADDSVRQRVQKLLMEHLGLEMERVKADDALLVPDHDDQGRVQHSQVPDLGCDSLDVVEIVMACEDEFRIEIPDDEAETLNRATVGQLIAMVERKVAAKQ